MPPRWGFGERVVPERLRVLKFWREAGQPTGPYWRPTIVLTDIDDRFSAALEVLRKRKVGGTAGGPKR